MSYLKELHNSISNCLHTQMSKLWNLRQNLTLERLNALALGVSCRATSKPPDEFICLGSLLELDVRAIARASPERRPYVFYSLLCLDLHSFNDAW